MATIILIMLIVGVLLILYYTYKPSVDYNPETFEYILWYNDLHDMYMSRKHVIVWRTKQ